MNNSRPHPMVMYQNSRRIDQDQHLIIEEPLSIRVNGKPYSVVMRTPGDEADHVAGFCLVEGLVDYPEDIASLGFCTEDGTNVATVILTPDRTKKVSHLLERKGFISQTSCGICGKEVVKDLQQILSPLPHTFKIPVSCVLECADNLAVHQELYQKTNSAHASMIFDADLRPLAFAEDVGRHNALDKAIGKVFMSHRLTDAVFGLMSSRLSYELVQKAARARLQVLVGISRPTALAVDLAQSIHMTIACAKNKDLMVFCGQDRLTRM
jgi:FdhD protein